MRTPTSPDSGLPAQPLDVELQLSDGQLVEMSVQAPHHFARLFDRHAHPVHRYLGRRVGDLADDLLSETFLIAFRQRAAYRPDRTTVLPWLYGIATNLVRNHHREENRRYRTLAVAAAGHNAGTPSFTADSDKRVDAQALTADIARSLAGLAADDRDVLLLFAWGQLSYQEIAAVQNIPIGTVRSRLHRARRHTQAALTNTLPREPR